MIILPIILEAHLVCFLLESSNCAGILVQQCRIAIPASPVSWSPVVRLPGIVPPDVVRHPLQVTVTSTREPVAIVICKSQSELQQSLFARV